MYNLIHIFNANFIIILLTDAIQQLSVLMKALQLQKTRPEIITLRCLDDGRIYYFNVKQEAI